MFLHKFTLAKHHPKTTDFPKKPEASTSHHVPKTFHSDGKVLYSISYFTFSSKWMCWYVHAAKWDGDILGLWFTLLRALKKHTPHPHRKKKVCVGGCLLTVVCTFQCILLTGWLLQDLVPDASCWVWSSDSLGCGLHCPMHADGYGYGVVTSWIWLTLCDTLFWV